jgi:DNA primase
MDPAEPKRYQSPHGPRGNAVIVVWSLRGLSRDLVVCEGPMDALAVAAVGYLGVALMGNTPPSSCFDYIAETFRTDIRREVLVVPDRDAPAEGAQWLAELTARDFRARAVYLNGKDLAALSPMARTEALR